MNIMWEKNQMNLHLWISVNLSLCHTKVMKACLWPEVTEEIMYQQRKLLWKIRFEYESVAVFEDTSHDG